MPARDPKTGRYVATASIDITIPLTKLARALSQARTMVGAGMRAMGRAIISTMTRAWTVATAAMARFTRMASRLARVFARLFLPLGALGGGLIGTLGLYKVLQTFATFEQSMARVRAVSGATEKEFAALSAEARRLGAVTVFSASQAAEAMGNFAVAGFSVNEILTAMEPTLNLASAGQLDMATASDIVAKTMRGMGLDATELTRAVDVMTNAFTTSNTDLQMLGDAFRYVGPVGKAAGKSLEELTAAIQMMSDAGIQGGQAGAALRNILLRLQAQPMEVKKALKKLGVEVGDESGKMKHLGDILDELRVSMARLTPIQKAAYLTQIAGTRASSAMNVLMDKGGDLLKERQELLKKEGTAAKIAGIQQDTLIGSLKILLSAAAEASIALGSVLAPAFRKIVTAMQPFALALGEALQATKPLVDWWSDRMVTAIEDATAFLKRNQQMFNRWGWQLTQVLANVEAGIARVFKWFERLFGLSESGAAQGLAGVLNKAIESLAILTTKPDMAMAAVGEKIKSAFWAGLAPLEAMLSWFWDMGYKWGDWFFKAFMDQLRDVFTLGGSTVEQKLDVLKALDEFLGAVRAGPKPKETAASRKAAAAERRAEIYWERAKAESAVQRSYMRAGGVFGMAPKLGTETPAGPGWTEGFEFPEAFPGEVLPSRRAQRLADLEVRRNRLAAMAAAAKDARMGAFRGGRRRAGYNDPERRWARRLAAKEHAATGITLEFADGEFDLEKAKVEGAMPPIPGGKGFAEEAIAKAAKEGKGGGGEIMGIEEYLAQLQKAMSGRKEDEIERNTAETARGVSERGPIVTGLAAIEKKIGGAARFA